MSENIEGLREIVYSWIRKDTPLAVKESLRSVVVEKLINRLAASPSPEIERLTRERDMLRGALEAFRDFFLQRAKALTPKETA